MGNPETESIGFVAIDEEGMVLIGSCWKCERTLTASLEYIVSHGYRRCKECGANNQFQKHNIERAKEIIAKFE